MTRGTFSIMAILALAISLSAAAQNSKQNQVPAMPKGTTDPRVPFKGPEFSEKEFYHFRSIFDEETANDKEAREVLARREKLNSEKAELIREIDAENPGFECICNENSCHFENDDPNKGKTPDATAPKSAGAPGGGIVPSLVEPHAPLQGAPKSEKTVGPVVTGPTTPPQ